MKLCKDCRWLIEPPSDWAVCHHPQAVWTEASLVTGKMVSHQYNCTTFRLGRFLCGPDGKLFESKDDPQTVAPTGFEP